MNHEKAPVEYILRGSSHAGLHDSEAYAVCVPGAVVNPVDDDYDISI